MLCKKKQKLKKGKFWKLFDIVYTKKLYKIVTRKFYKKIT